MIEDVRHQDNRTATRPVLLYVALSVVVAVLMAVGAGTTRLAARQSPHPDLEGVWSFATVTPLERPQGLSKATFSNDAERVAFLEQDNRQRLDQYVNERKGGVAPYGAEWYDWGTDTNRNRTSLIVDPEDGRLPPLRPEARQRAAARGQAPRPPQDDGPENRSLQERCIVGPNAGPPMIPSFYNNLVQIAATDSYAMLVTEMIHTPRVVPLQPVPDHHLRQYGGASRGRWEADSLVIETSNFREDAAAFILRGASAQLRLTERFSRADGDTLRYEFTVDDPATWMTPWTAVVYMTKSKEPMYEYACHEGNYGLRGILSGARVTERRAAQSSHNGAQNR
jgi:hypothetical protein